MENLTLNFEGVESKPLSEFTRKAYLDYAMYVILDRALPNIADGLKPVQRRIVYAMSELGLRNTAKYKKSARTVGDVLGKFHPHGDSACYEAMVLMAQPFSYRYPLVDGQGNWGSVDDPKSFAAMRYTESKLSAYADLLYKELGQGTVEWTPNFDGSLTEPCMLPAQVPNVLLNGGSGIAVGMATDIPPHNLTEIITACRHLLKFPNATFDKILEIIPAPDFPMGAEIVSSKADIEKMYKTGSGSIRMRATFEIEDGEIIISSIPYHASPAKILEQIAAQMRAKKLPMVSDLRDESDHDEPVRLVITPRSNRIDLDALMAHLFATTDLEKSTRVNLNMIGLDGKPQVKNLKQILSEWLIFRIDTVRRKLQFRLNKVEARLHILDGLLIAYLNLDEVIRIIRTSDQPKQDLIARFKLTDIQADAILETKLRHLAKLEEMKIRDEQESLKKEQAELKEILGSEDLLKSKVSTELLEIQKIFGDARRSQLVERSESKAFKEEELMPVDNVTVVLSKLGWVRAAKGHEIDPEALSYKSGDGYLVSAQGKSNMQVAFIDQNGKCYSASAHGLPSARGQGEPLTGRFSPGPGVQFVSMAMASASRKILLGSNAGYGFITQFEQLHVKAKKGKNLISLPSGAKILRPLLVPEISESNSNLNIQCVMVSQSGRIVSFDLSEIPELNRGKGNKLMGIHAADFSSQSDGIVDWCLVSAGQMIKVHAGKKYLKINYSELLDQYHTARAKRGAMLPKGYRNVSGLELV